MSEYQYYEFRALDRPLTEREQAALRRLSTRADISAHSFTNHYEWGDFRGDPRKLMERHYDAFLYLANWGTHQLMFRLPRAQLPLKVARAYCPGDDSGAQAWAHGTHVLLELVSEDEDGEGWEDDETEALAAILPVRTEIAQGDLRPLYLAWLLAAQSGTLPEDTPEPPVPPGLGRLSGAQRALAEFLRVDPALVKAAARNSPALAVPRTQQADLERWVKGLPAAEQTHWLVRIAQDAPVRAELLQAFHRSRPSRAKPVPARTVAELLDLAGFPPARE